MSAPLPVQLSSNTPQWLALPNSLRKKLYSHDKWLTSSDAPLKQRTGRKADFTLRTEIAGLDLSNCNLTRACFAGAVLTKTKFTNARLVGADLHDAHLFKANLRGADLSDADLSNADLRNADLTDATFYDADLTNADLTGAINLRAGHLAGAILTHAKLPAELATFDGLRTAEEMSKNSGKYFVALMTACAYVVLTILTASDLSLFTESATATLPIVGIQINTVGFYQTAPLVLLAAYLYFHLDLQRLWDTLAKLPAVFPDGRTLDEKSYPWLLGSLAHVYAQRLRNGEFKKSNVKPLMSGQKWLSIFLAWYVVPVTLLVVWGRYIRRHDPTGTSWHVELLLMSLLLAWTFRVLAKWTLTRDRLRHPLLFFAFNKGWQSWGGSLLVVIGAGALFYCSPGLINAIPLEDFDAQETTERIQPEVAAQVSDANNQVYISVLYNIFHYQDLFGRIFFSLDYANIATSPSNWKGKDKPECDQVPVVLLRNRDLRYASLNNAFMVHVNLSKANLNGAQLTEADLRDATLEYAYLTANLKQANLEFADLKYAHLEGAGLTRADLKKADLTGADLTGANLSGADLSSAIVTLKQMEVANIDERTKIPVHWADHRSRLIQQSKQRSALQE